MCEVLTPHTPSTPHCIATMGNLHRGLRRNETLTRGFSTENMLQPDSKGTSFRYGHFLESPVPVVL